MHDDSANRDHQENTDPIFPIRDKSGVEKTRHRDAPA